MGDKNRVGCWIQIGDVDMKSLFSKFLLIVSIVIFISFVTMFFSLKNMLENHFIDMKAEQLINHAKGIQESYSGNRLFGGLTTLEIENEIDNLEQYFQAEIWIVDQRGYVYVTSQDQNIDKIKAELNIDEVNEIFSGKIVNREGHYQSVSNETLITIAYPIEDSSGQVIFALYIHVPVPEVLEANQGLFQVALTVFIIIFIFAIGIIFIFTRNMIGDIKSLNATVEAIAKGQFQERHKSNRKDEIGRLSSSMNHMAQSLEDADEFRRHFISDLSHDFRSPLTNIIGYSQGILDETISKEDHLKSIKIIRDESKRLLMLSDGILTLSDLSKHQLKISMLNIEAMILQILDYESLKIEKKNLSIKIDFPDKHIPAKGDEVLIHRVLYNLIDNAIKFSKEASEITIHVENLENRVQTSIANETLENIDTKRIWDRFSKGDASRGQDIVSFGLGLSIVQDVLKLHHQEAHVSIKDGWIIFDFQLEL